MANLTEEEVEEAVTKVVMTMISSLTVAAEAVVAAAVVVVAVVAMVALTPPSKRGEESRVQNRVSWNEGHTSAAGKSPVPM